MASKLNGASSGLLARLEAVRSPAAWVPDGHPDTLAQPVKPAVPEPDISPARSGRSKLSQAFQETKSRVHRKLIERLDLTRLELVDRDQVLSLIRKVLQDLLVQEPLPLNFDERELLVVQVLDEIFGLGPLQPLMDDPDIADILVNTYECVYVEKRGKLSRTDVRFQDETHLLQIIDRIVSAVGRRIDESSPMVDARLADGSRVNAIIPPLAIDGAHISIRKFKRDKLTAEDLMRADAMSSDMVALLEAIVKSRLNVIISGGTGSGKTTMLNMLSNFIPSDERIVTIEDSAELQLRQPHVVRLETRPPNIEAQGEISQRLLVINALRMRPDRIILGEVRGPEAIDMLQAMNTGHDGSLATLHANTPRDALARLETMCAMADLHLPDKAVKQQISSAVHVIVQVGRLSDGTRKVLSIAEIAGSEGDVITMQEIFQFERQGLSESGRVLGRFKPTGIRPKFSDRLKTAGIELPASMFTDTTKAAAPTKERWA
jgi:pilus assembly protein CpaF